jgi:hypothetical protein
MSTMIAATDPKNSRPAIVRMEVDCHSVIRAVTSGFADRPAA